MLNKQAVPISFTQGLNLKSDPFQLSIGEFLKLENSVFTTQGRLTKRNGYGKLTTLPNSLQTTLTTLNDSLIATGSNLYSYSTQTNAWQNQGIIQPINITTKSIVRSSFSQVSPDSATAANGLMCVGYTEGNTIYYTVVDSVTGQTVVQRVAIANPANNIRVFVLGVYFIVTFVTSITGVFHLQYIAIPISNPTAPSNVTDISSVVSALNAGYDGVVNNNNLYLAFSATSSTVKIAFLSSTLQVFPAVTLISHAATLMSITVDNYNSNNPIIWVAFYDAASSNGFVAACNSLLNVVLASTQFLSGTTITELTSVANNQTITVFYQNQNTFAAPYPNGGVRTDYISKNTVTQAGTVGTASIIRRSVGLASKAFIDPSGVFYMWGAYADGTTNQPTYFLLDSSGNIYAKLAYANGGGYPSTTGSQILPSVNHVNGSYIFAYLYKDFLAPVNNGTNTGLPSNAIYTNTGINICQFAINASGQYSSEIAQALHLTGGFVWEYDGVKPVEHGFHVYPENLAYTTTTTGGNMTAQLYYYVFCYEWTDSQGMLHRSAPSIPFKVDLTSAGTATSVNTIYVPTLRLTNKQVPNGARLVGYRWSVGQQVYYQITSVSNPVKNDTSVDFIAYVDVMSDVQILGTTILYTTGGVVENIAAPPCISSTLFDDRMWVIDAEDQNLLWFSKQVIEATPVEFSDLLTIYVAPSIGAQNSTGPLQCLSPMDDKLILFKKDALYYINGTGPDNTGSNNQYSQPIFVSSSVGSDNQNSIVLTPDGLMFQSDKGIWLLDRGLNTTYIGAPVEAYNGDNVSSAQVIPDTTQVRFVLDSGMILMYDYFFKKWGTFTTNSAITSTLYNGLHTYLNAFGGVLQETPGIYLDDANPVLVAFTTSWINLAGLQGFQRFYSFYLFGVYLSPFKLNVNIGYNYNSSSTQNIIVTPDNQTPNWGGEALWGSGSNWGGGTGTGSSTDHSANIFSARVFPEQQKCESFQLAVQELYDPSFNQAPGAGLTLSGLNIVIGTKKGYRIQRASQQFG